MSRTSQRAARPGGALISAQVVQTLLAELRTGRYASAARLPPELTLPRTLGVSRSVVRDALGELERAGYVERVRGIGTLVNRGALAVRRRLDRKLEFTQMILAAGRTPHTDHLVVTRQQPDDATAAALGLCAAQTVLVVGKRLLADDRPVLYCTDFIPLALFPGERVDGIDFTRPIFSILQEHCGIETTTAVTRLHAVRGDAAARRLLGCGPESALLELEETCYSHLCRPVLRSRTLYTDYLDLAFVRRLSG